jgi:hypothetical protein
MRIVHGRSKKWVKAELLHGETGIKRMVFREYNRRKRRRLNRRAAGLNRSIPLARRQAIHARWDLVGRT